MKKMYVVAALLAFTVVSCKKENDPRDKFVGTYKAVQSISMPDLNWNDVEEGEQIIKKASEPDYILFGTPDDNTWNRAHVSGNSYVYDKIIDIDNSGGSTAIWTLTGSGTIDGSIIRESGTVILSYMGKDYYGTWSSTLTKY